MASLKRCGHGIALGAVAFAAVACSPGVSGGVGDSESPETATTVESVPGSEPAASDPDGSVPDDLSAQRYPDIIGVEATCVESGIYDFSVTISSPYDTADRYADGWRVRGPDDPDGDIVFGEHQLMHDHANEQPFTRTQRGVPIPDDVEVVTIEGRDQRYGYGGETMTVELPACR